MGAHAVEISDGSGDPSAHPSGYVATAAAVRESEDTRVASVVGKIEAQLRGTSSETSLYSATRIEAPDSPPPVPNPGIPTLRSITERNDPPERWPDALLGKLPKLVTVPPLSAFGPASGRAG